MMLRRLLSAALLTTAVVAISAPTATAAPRYNYVGWSGGTLIHAIGTTISSDLTAQSYVSGIIVPKGASNNVDYVRVGTLARTGGVETSEHVTKLDDGVKLRSYARTANASLLNGLITADVVETTNVTTASPTNGFRTHAHTRYVGLHIGDSKIPVDIPKNFKVEIPGIATVIVNGQEIERHDGILTSTGYGLKVVLLSAFGGAGLHSTIILNPTFAGLAPEVPINHPRLAGYAFGTRVHTLATSDIQVDSGRTANVSTAPGGSGNLTVSNSTTRAYVRYVLNTGAVYSTTKSLSKAGFGEVTNHNEITGVNILSGLIRADVIGVTAHAKRVGNTFSGSNKMTFVNLIIAGNEIPIDVSPNTRIRIGDIATVIINKRDNTPQSRGITGLWIKLLQPRGDVPAGAIIEISQALAWIPPLGT